MTTNKVVAVQHTRESLDLGGPRFSKVKLLDGREVFVESGLVVRGQGLEQIVGKAEYSDVVGDLVVQALVEGASMVSICKDLGIKYSVVDRWRKGECVTFNYITYDQLKSYYSQDMRFVKFKEWYFDKSTNTYKPTEGDGYLVINLDKVDVIRIVDVGNHVCIGFNDGNDVYGMFFV